MVVPYVDNSTQEEGTIVTISPGVITRSARSFLFLIFWAGDAAGRPSVNINSVQLTDLLVSRDAWKLVRLV